MLSLLTTPRAPFPGISVIPSVFPSLLVRFIFIFTLILHVVINTLATFDSMKL